MRPRRSIKAIGALRARGASAHFSPLRSNSLRPGRSWKSPKR
jgi:hypothetical protein